jgi:hypothetical protein
MVTPEAISVRLIMILKKSTFGKNRQKFRRTERLKFLIYDTTDLPAQVFLASFWHDFFFIKEKEQE